MIYDNGPRHNEALAWLRIIKSHKFRESKIHLLLLKFNRRLWDDPGMIDEILADLRAVNDPEANDGEMWFAYLLLCMMAVVCIADWSIEYC